MERGFARRELLRFIAHYDGQWYWDVVDPSRSDHRTAGNPTFEADCREAMQELAAAELIELRPNTSLGPPARYWLTEAGRQAVAKLGDI